MLRDSVSDGLIFSIKGRIRQESNKSREVGGTISAGKVSMRDTFEDDLENSFQRTRLCTFLQRSDIL